MDTNAVMTHPATAQQAKAFTAPASLSFPGGLQVADGTLTPPSSVKEGSQPSNNGGTQQNTDGAANGNGAPSQGDGQPTPASTPAGANASAVNNIVPTLQYVPFLVPRVVFRFSLINSF